MLCQRTSFTSTLPPRGRPALLVWAATAETGQTLEAATESVCGAPAPGFSALETEASPSLVAGTNRAVQALCNKRENPYLAQDRPDKFKILLDLNLECHSPSLIHHRWPT